MDIDTTTEYGQRVSRRLREEQVIWFVTVNRDGTPEPSPVWFYWDGETILIYSLRDTARQRNVLRNGRVALHFDSTQGGNVVVFTGEASVAQDAPAAHANPPYAEKYRDGFRRIGVTAEQFSQRYSLPIRVRPTKLRGF